MNLETIAKKAGVSKSTVSRVVNDDPNVSDTTRKKVMDIIDREGFTPNHAARSLVTRRTQTIGVVIPRTLSVLFDGSLYFPPLLRGISRGLTERDHTMILWIDHEETPQAKIDLRILRNQMVDGFVVISPTVDGELMHTLMTNDINFVSADRVDYLYPEASFVTVENVESSAKVIDHLYKLGRRKIGTITGSVTIVDTLDRIKGYRLGIERNGMTYDDALVYRGEFVYQTGYEGAKYLLAQNVDAIFAQLDIMAMGAIDAINEAGLRVPEDIAIVGFDDLPPPYKMTTQLSTVRQPIKQKGYELAHVLVDLIQGVTTKPVHKFLPTELVIRDTCGGVPEPNTTSYMQE